MTYTYGIICETFSMNGKMRTAYGIAVFAHTEHTECNAIIAVVNDLSSDRESVENLINACNEGKLSLIHLNDVVDDYLAK